MSKSIERIKFSVSAAAIQFIFGAFFYLILGFWIFRFGYIFPYFEILRVLPLYLILGGVLLAIGPLPALVIVDPFKLKNKIWMDMVLLGLLQCCALIYGALVIFDARPVYVVFEVDRFRVVLASEIEKRELDVAPEKYRPFPFWGVRQIGVRDPRDTNELFQSIELSMKGKEPSLRPGWWVDYESVRDSVKKKARPLNVLMNARPEKIGVLNVALQRAGKNPSQVLWVPLTSVRGGDWVALLNAKTGEIVGAAPIDGFI